MGAGINSNSGSSIKNNYSATVDPTTSDDAAHGYSSGSEWRNTISGSIFKCVSAATGAASWVLIAGESTSEAITVPFTAVDGSVGVTVEHNFGYYPIAQLVLDPVGGSGDKEVLLIDNHTSANSFTAYWVGTRSGRVVYYKQN